MHQADVIPQQSDEVCWAASAQAMARSFKIRDTQCEQLQDYAGYVCPFCLKCDDSRKSDVGGCNHGGWPDFERIKVHCERTHSEALSLKQIQTDIGCKHQPVVFSWQTGFASSHMMVVYGYSGDKLDVMQPLKECVGDTFTIDYDTYRDTDVDGGSHLDDFYDCVQK